MKQFFSTCAICFIALSSSAQNPKNFIGSWVSITQPVNQGGILYTIIIKGDHFEMISSKASAPLRLDYDKKDGALHGKMADTRVTIAYDSKKQHLIFTFPKDYAPEEYKKAY